MMSKDSRSYKMPFYLFIAGHLIVWTLVPTIVNHNLPLDVIEGLAWGNEGQWGYYKHPPLSPWLMDLFAGLSGSSDWAQYLLSQLSVALAFTGMWFLAREVLPPLKALVSVLMLEGIYYHGYSSPEFNANVILLPVWSMAIFIFYKAIESRQLFWWPALGITAGLAMYGKYFSIFLLVSMLGYLLLTKKGRRQFSTTGPYVALGVMILLLLPHLNWMIKADFSTVKYGLNRASPPINSGLMDHFLFPVKFIISQLLLLLPLGFMLAALGVERDRFLRPHRESRANTSLLAYLAFGPPLLMVILSVTMGWKLRAMWGTPLFLMSGLLLVYFFNPRITKTGIRRFITVFLFFALLGPIAYVAVYALRPVIKEGGKRTQFPGQEMARQMREEWQKRYPGKALDTIIGDVWMAGNAAYYLKSGKSIPRPFGSRRTASVFIDGDVMRSPWINPLQVKQSGGIVVWALAGKPADGILRARLKKMKFSPLIDMTPLQLPRATWMGKQQQLKIHWALLPPE